MATLIPLLVAAATLAFGGVYPWGYLPLVAAAAVIGLCGTINRPGVLCHARLLGLGLVLVTTAVGAQLVPLSRGGLNAISPHVPDFLSRYNLLFAVTDTAHSISIDPSATAMALLALGSLGLYLLGAPGTLSSEAVRALPRNLILFAVPLALLGS